ncbi:unnamed protein product [Leuciscus chuanchicus]
MSMFDFGRLVVSISRYLGSQFMGHSKSEDLLHHFKKCVHLLDLKHLISISMDGPNVNFKFLNNLQQEHGELHGGRQLISVGSCGLHTVHNSFKTGFSAWNIEKLLRAMHYVFHNVPARREDYTKLTGTSLFPLPFCGHRWVENLPVAERAIEVWTKLKEYVEAVRRKELPNPGTSSFDTIEAANKDPLILAKLQFFMALSRTFCPFLKKYQTDEPVLPFLCRDLTELMMSLVRRFIKRELLQDITPFKLTKLDTDDQKNWVSASLTDIGLGAESVLKALQSKSSNRVGDLTVLEFRRDCIMCLSRIVKKMQEKSPLKYPTVRQIACLDPSVMSRDPEWCKGKMKSLVQRFLQDKQLTGGVSAGDAVVQQFDSFLSLHGKSEEFLSFKPMEQRLDTFLHQTLNASYPELRSFIQRLLLLSHGQATVERGFSVNKEVETCNIKEETVEAHRLVCDQVHAFGGVLKVSLTKELLASVASARTRYRIYLDEERRKREGAMRGLKRKALEDELEELKKKKGVLTVVCASLQKDADQLAEQAENKSKTLMAEMITKSNTLRRRFKEKCCELKNVESELELKSTELRHMP